MNPEAAQRCERRGWPQEPKVVSVHHPCLSLPPPTCGLRAITQETTLRCSHLSPPPPSLPSFFPLTLLLCILQDEECPPAAIVAKMWSELLFPARLHLFPPALIPDRGFVEPGNWPTPADRRTEGERERPQPCLPHPPSSQVGLSSWRPDGDHGC